MTIGGLYDIEFEGSTGQAIDIGYIDSAYGFWLPTDRFKGLPLLQKTMYDELMNDLPVKAFEKFESEGNIRLISADVMKLEVWYHTFTVTTPAPPFIIDYAVYHYRATLRIATTEPLSSSPLDPLTIALIAKVILAIITAIMWIIIAYFAIQAIKDWLISMTTTTTRIVTYDPETGKIIETWTTQPSLGGILAVGVGAGIAILCAAFAYSLLRKKG